MYLKSGESMNTSYLKNEKGSALAYVMIVMVVLFVLVGGIVVVAQNENFQAIYQNRYTKAYYIARAGAEAMVVELKDLTIAEQGELFGGKVAEASNVLGTSGDVEVTVTRDDLTHYTIHSVGSFENVDATVIIHMVSSEESETDVLFYSENPIDGGGLTDDISFKDGSSEGPIVSGEHIEIKDSDVDKIEHYIQTLPRITNIYPDLTRSGIDLDGSYFDVVTDHYNNGNGTLVIEEPTYFNTTYKSGSDTLSGMTVKTITIETEPSPAMTKPRYKKNKLLFPDNPLDVAKYGVDYFDAQDASDLTIAGSELSDVNYTLLSPADFDTYFTAYSYDGYTPGTSDDEWVLVYFEGDVDISQSIIVNGNKNVMLFVEDSLTLGGLIINGSGQVDVYIMDKTGYIPLSPDEVDDINPDPLVEDLYDSEYDLILNSNTDFGVSTASNRLNFYVYDNNSVDISNNSNIYGYIYGPNARVDLKNGNTVFQGGLFAGEINMEASVTIVAPSDSTSITSTYIRMKVDYWE